MKTFMANAATIERKWYVVDAEGKTIQFKKSLIDHFKYFFVIIQLSH